MIKALVQQSTEKLNYFPPKGGISSYYSPHILMMKRWIVYDRHCHISFGTYVQAHQDNSPKNTQEPRTLDCIYLHPTDNDQGGHTVLDLATGRTITRPHVTPVPITSAVISAVETMAEQEGMKGLRFKTKSGQILWDSAWIAGVDYDKDDQEEYYDDKNVELPGVKINEEQEEQLWEELDPNNVADLVSDAQK